MELNSNSPLYSQVAEHIRSDITRGTILPGQRLSAIRELAATYKVVPNTVVKALELLANEGLILSRRTSGYFVTEDVECVARIKRTESMKITGEFYHKMLLMGYTKAEVVQMLADYEEDDKETGLV